MRIWKSLVGGAALLGIMCMSAEAQNASPPNDQCQQKFAKAIDLKAGFAGSTTLMLNIDRDGNVKSATITQPSGNPQLDAAAVDCVTSTWHFKPARVNGDVVEISFPYTFKWQVHPS